MRFLLVALCLAVSPAFAGPVIDANIFYFTDGFTYGGSTTTVNRTLWDLSVGMNLSKKGQWVLGWNYDSMSFSDNPGVITTVAITDMGPKVTYYIDKARTWSLAVTYDLITKAAYNSAGTITELRGTAIKVEAGYTPEMWDGILMGAKINYYKPTFAEEIVSTSLTKVAYGRAVIYPSFAFIFRWD